MATEKNITMKQFNGTDYDTLYPKTIASQIPDVYSKTDTITAETLNRLGLSADKLPNDAFQQIKTLIDNVQSSTDSKAKIQTGSYVGTGTYGAGNPCSLTFDTLPKLIWFFASESGSGSSRNFNFYSSQSSCNPYLIPGKDFSVNLYYGASGGFRNSYVYQKVEGNTVFWWSTSDANYGPQQQGNISNNTYYYIAFM